MRWNVAAFAVALSAALLPAPSMGAEDDLGKLLDDIPDVPNAEQPKAEEEAAPVEAEVATRRELLYPPFSRLLSVRIDAGNEGAARRVAAQLANLARHHPAATGGRIAVLGPAPAPIPRLRGRFRYRVMLRSPDRKALRAVAAALAARIDDGVSPARASVDVDPVNML